ncbi:hypothetical protein PHLGIDRAFT_384795 [Phlebiopsis gigantea 11061_1 CR5-6]|uniref:Uncharacterized protein n=1 Tax=Phlebiopsis gigantea (strain 11061_1 CR5-6) TaxID=745531 RepID=A0A0C3S9G3_PHLG1|nr:hypothetical protein PHLGIDRAFT_384795 [Phlebiopsis gigantea 11061_1 CR5-6]
MAMASNVLSDANNARHRSPPMPWSSKITAVAFHFFWSSHTLRRLSELVESLHGQTAITQSVGHATPSHSRRPDVQNFYLRWSRFSQCLTGQWQAMNYVSAVFVGTMATMLQDPTVFGHTVGRTCITVAFLCSLASLCCGSMLSIHLSNVKSVGEAAVWTTNLHGMSSNLWSNPVVALAAPAVWLILSALFFVATLIASYVWQPPDAGTHIVSRVIIGCVIVAWLAQTISMVWTLHELRTVPEALLGGIPDLDVDLENGRNSMS